MAVVALPGQPFPLGVTLTPTGANVALATRTAEAVTLCLIDAEGAETRVPLTEQDAGVWHGLVPGIRAGQRYGFRVDGPFDPARGLRFDAKRLLVDPYARAIAADTTENYSHVGLVVDESFDWGDDRAPMTPYADTVIYETHVKGFTQLHPDVPVDLRGTYEGLGHPAALQHLVDLGVTAVELLPVHESLTEPSVAAHGLTNYWGYNTLGFFAPQSSYSAEVRAQRPGGQVAEFKQMVTAIHAAGLEVILDVVFNHTAEGPATGPTMSFRGIDNPAYYRLDPNDLSQYIDTTGCGNSLNAGDETALRLIMDSLRYWVQQMHVDGFRFDLAPTLAREDGAFEKSASFFDLVAQDPVISRVKLIAEPWDVGQGDSYDIGRFPPLWSEWNGSYRDTVRDFWRSKPGLISTLATRITGSEDLYGTDSRRPTASVNFVTVHDGFTLRDLVSYDHKHNEANREGNRDGTSDNRSWNCGVEGETDDAEIIALRERQRRAMLTTLLTSFGIPMLLGGDEFGRTQQGNNNAYCQDSPISWIDWTDVDAELLAFTQRLVRLRREHPVLRRTRFLRGPQAVDIEWYTPSGDAMGPDDWSNPDARSLVVYLDGTDSPDIALDGTLMPDEDMLLMVNAWWEPLQMRVPGAIMPSTWTCVLDSFDASVGLRPAPSIGPGEYVTVGPRSVMILCGSRVGAPDAEEGQ